MQYRTFGRLDWKPSALGFGAMRLPVLTDEAATIDEPEATRMIHYAIDHGVNYVDTAYTYHRSKGEALVGRALQGGYREKVCLATKMPCWLIEAPADFDRYLDEQLGRLQTSYLDFYLLHSLHTDTWSKVRGLGVLPWAERALSDGRIRHLGFSFHDRYEVFQEIVDASDLWTLCQIQYNYMDEELQAGRKGLQYAAAKGLAVVVMEPIRGGQLTNPPESVAALWASAARKRTPADWALQWVWNQPEVSLLLSGMSTMAQVVENIASADSSAPGRLTAEELALVHRVREAYHALIPISCTDCKYCQPCPSGVNIPEIFRIYNEGVMYGSPERARMFYSWLKAEQRADQCAECAECEEKCPQQIEIIDWLKKVRAFVGDDGGAKA